MLKRSTIRESQPNLNARHGITPDRFRELVEPLLGLKLSKAQRGYGSALVLDFGKLRREPALPRPRTATPTARLRGEASVLIEWSWRVERARSIEAGSWSTEAGINACVAGLAGHRLTAIDVAGRLPELVLGLSDGRRVQSFMTAPGQPEWALFLLDGSWVCVERGRLVQDVQNQRSATPRRPRSA